MLHTVVRCWPE